MNNLASAGTPFLFIVDYAMQKIKVWQLDEIPQGIYYQIGPYQHIPSTIYPKKKIELSTSEINFQYYEHAFQQVQDHLHRGDTYLLNLTQPTPIQINYTLAEVFMVSKAYAKLLVNDEFVVFSPEKFIEISNQKISTFPMKGTIDARLPHAAQIILNDKKEASEHATIVDLLRNDLSLVARNVTVTNYRYTELIHSQQQKLIQVSSSIEGQLPKDYQKHLGDIVFKLLPAGSICGAPKPKTLDIISAVEKYNRGYYTGVFGVFDKNKLYSAVMIRFIEKTKTGFVYKSGGGITAQSNCQKEFQELNQKIYVPTC